jgi:SagB-type dehydrogenase family enzyme
MSLAQTLATRRSIREYAPDPLSLDDVSQLLWSASGVTDAETGYRTTPSAGATFPLETYLIAGAVDGLEPGVYRYDPTAHALEKTADSDTRAELGAACYGQNCVTTCAAAILFSAVYSRITEVYGDAGPKFAAMEAGHAAQNISLQAVALDLGAVAIGVPPSEQLKNLAAMRENEEPLYMMVFGKPKS